MMVTGEGAYKDGCSGSGTYASRGRRTTSALFSDDEPVAGLVDALADGPAHCLLRLFVRPILHSHQQPKPQSCRQLSNGQSPASGSRCCYEGAASSSRGDRGSVHSEGTSPLQDRQ